MDQAVCPGFAFQSINAQLTRLPDRIALSGEQVISGAIPFLEKLECFFEPRWPFFTSPETERCVGVILLVLGFIIALLIAFGNMLPAIAIVLICLGLIEKDALIIAISGLIAGITPSLLLLVL